MVLIDRVFSNFTPLPFFPRGHAWGIEPLTIVPLKKTLLYKGEYGICKGCYRIGIEKMRRSRLLRCLCCNVSLKGINRGDTGFQRAPFGKEMRSSYRGDYFAFFFEMLFLGRFLEELHRENGPKRIP